MSYNKEQYDIVLEDHFDILFKDCYDENNCRKHKFKSPKVTKRLLFRSAHKKDSDDDGLKVKKTKGRKKSIDHVVSTKLSECMSIVIFFKRCQMCTHKIMCTHIILFYFPNIMCIRIIFSS